MAILLPETFVLPVLLLFVGNSHSTTFTLENNCPYTIWAATISSTTSSSLVLGSGGDKGSELLPNATNSHPAPPNWSGRFWARTGCLLSKPTCATGDTLPFTLAEFTLSNEKDSYYVNLLNGYNVGIGVSAAGCKYAGCMGDLNERCPAELRVEGPSGETVACRTPCEAFGGEQYCCTGAHSTEETCGPTRYSQLFKAACPNAYSYVYDDATNTCAAGSDYRITFCPSATAGRRRR